MSDVKLILCVVDPVLEVSILDVLSASGIEAPMRYLTPEEVPSEVQSQSILITTPTSILGRNVIHPSCHFRKVISIGDREPPGALVLGENELARLPELIAKLLLPAQDSHDASDLKLNPLVHGVLPRVGASTVLDLIERYAGEQLLLIRNQKSLRLPRILCTEIDDISLLRTFEFLSKEIDSQVKRAVVINKVPDTKLARKRLTSVEFELKAFDVALVQPIYFDGEIQVDGAPSQRTIRLAQPLFDWIANSN